MLIRTCPAALVPRACSYGLQTVPHSCAIARPAHNRHPYPRQLQHSAVHACSAACLLAFEACTRPLAPCGSNSSFKCRQPSMRSRHFSGVKRNALPLAMVNVDFASPSLVLGVTLIGCGIALLQVRNMQREVSRDADIVVAAMISIVGSTLIFQGWRLDPLLLLCQALTTSVAFWYGLEAFKLRAEVVQEDEQQGPGAQGQQLPPAQDQALNSQQQDFNSARSGYLPSAMDRPAPWGQQQQQQPLTGYGPNNGSSSSSRWGLPPGQSSIPYESYTAGQANGMQDSMYAGYDAGLMDRGQQQYSSAAGGYGGGYGSNGAYLPQVPPVFDQQQVVESQVGQQPPQYQWNPQGNEQQQGLPAPYLQQQQQQPPVWFDAAGFPVNAGMLDNPQQQAPYDSLPGLPEPNPTRAGASAQPDASMAPGIPGSDSSSSGLPLPAFAEQQQQQQGPSVQQGGLQGRVKGRYEQVDDWE